jgi:D-alanine-D-alanine ligase-like ATP-grasp enzyme
MAGVKYVGAGVLASAVGIDKEYMKVIFAARGLPVVRHVVVRERDWPLPGAGEATPESKRVLDAIAELGWPLFVKPARGGSSIGTSKASDMASCTSPSSWPASSTARSWSRPRWTGWKSRSRCSRASQEARRTPACRAR